MITLSRGTELTAEMVERYINADFTRKAHLERLYDYYKGKHDIKNRVLSDTSKPNNKIANPYPNYITDIMTGYFMGEPVKYTSTDNSMIDSISNVFNYNDEAAENSELAKDASIFGVAYELMYIDIDKEIRFKKISPIGAIPIYDDSIENELLYFIRYWDNVDILSGNTTRIIEVYSDNSTNYYKSGAGMGAITLTNTIEHFFKLVPIAIYQNNEEEMGDFEIVIDAIDAYDKTISDGVNNLDYFANAYFVLTNVDMDDSDIQMMKERRTIKLPLDGKAEWLVKNSTEVDIESVKNTLDENIHKFSKCPKLTDKDFAANASGVAMKYKLMGIDNVVSKKERAFKKALQRRIEVICQYLYTLGQTFDYRQISMTFSRNIPANLTEIADTLTKIGYLLSEDTQRSLLPIDIDLEDEAEKKQKEQESGYSIMDETAQATKPIGFQ